MSKPAFSISDLQRGAKSLNTAPPAEDKKVDSKASQEVDREALQKLEDLYIKHEGDLDLIFAELKADPTKAKKPHNRPKTASEFASKYLEGRYSLLVSGEESGGSSSSSLSSADAKDSHK